MLYVLNPDIHVWDHLPGKRCIRTLTSLSNELKTKLQRHTINAQASGPCEDLKWLNTSWTSSGNKQGYFSYLCKREANHEKFFILWIEENHYKEKGVGIVAKVLQKKREKINLKVYTQDDGFRNGEDPIKRTQNCCLANLYLWQHSNCKMKQNLEYWPRYNVGTLFIR